MRIRTKTPITVSLSLAACCLFPGPVFGGDDGRPRPVSLRGTEVREIRSSIIDQNFKLHVYLPAGYSDSTRVFPVVYLTDSDAYFGFFRSLVANLHYGNMIPEVLVVGIAYEENVESYMRKRERDLLPATVANHPGSGNAARFLEFMDTELLPFVESQYRVVPNDRTIIGMSAGATFALYVLLSAPGIFDRYVIVSPYLIYGQETVLDLERAYAKTHDTLPARVYTAMGELEPPYAREPWEALAASLIERGYTGFTLDRDLLEGLSHMDVVFTAFANGMKAVFSDRWETLPAVPVNFAACAGRYEISTQGTRFTVRMRGGRLAISRSGEYWDALTPVSDGLFGIDGNTEVQFSFVADGTGAVRKMIIHQLGMQIPAERID